MGARFVTHSRRRVTRQVSRLLRCHRGAFNQRPGRRGKICNIVSRSRAPPWAPTARAWRHTPAHAINADGDEHASGHARGATCTCAHTSVHEHIDTRVREHAPVAVRGIPVSSAHLVSLSVPSLCFRLVCDCRLHRYCQRCLCDIIVQLVTPFMQHEYINVCCTGCRRACLLSNNVHSDVRVTHPRRSSAPSSIARSCCVHSSYHHRACR